MIAATLRRRTGPPPTTTAEVLADREVDGEEAWKTARRDGIGASEIAAVVRWYEQRHGLAPLHDVGPPPFLSAFAIWAAKVGVAPDPDVDTETVHWGRTLEPVIMAQYATDRYSGRDTMTEAAVLRSAEHPRLLASPDGWTYAHRDGVARWLPAEAKLSGLTAEWVDGPPTRNWWQGQQQALVAGTDATAFVAYLGAHDGLRWIDVDLDERAARRIERAAREFWAHVEAREQPEPDEHRSTRRTLEYLHPDDDGSTVELPARMRDRVEELRALREQRRVLDGRVHAIENELRALLGSATYGVLPGGPTVSLKTQERAASVTRASKFRVLRVQAPRSE